MNLGEFVVLTVVALYAMVGGAFINAAITAPARCLRVLAWMWGEVINTFLVTGFSLTIGGVVLGLLVEKTWAEVGGGVTALGLAHLSLFVLFLGARRVATAALDTEERATLLPPKR